MSQVSMDALLSGLLERMGVEDFADVCDTLVWRFEDNGTEMSETLRSWLKGDDTLRIQAALTFNGGLLFRSPEEMEVGFARLIARHPQFRERTEAIHRGWVADLKRRAVYDAVQRNWPLSTVAGNFRISEDVLRRWIDEDGIRLLERDESSEGSFGCADPLHRICAVW